MKTVGRRGMEEGIEEQIVKASEEKCEKGRTARSKGG
jgi:hypothetical protein